MALASGEFRAGVFTRRWGPTKGSRCLVSVCFSRTASYQSAARPFPAAPLALGHHHRLPIFANRDHHTALLLAYFLWLKGPQHSVPSSRSLCLTPQFSGATTTTYRAPRPPVHLPAVLPLSSLFFWPRPVIGRAPTAGPARTTLARRSRLNGSLSRSCSS